MATNWLSPTGYDDPESGWTNEVKAYDESTSTYAYTLLLPPLQGVYLHLTHSEIYAVDRVRYFLNSEPVAIVGLLFVLYGASYPGGYKTWRDLQFQGPATIGSWKEVDKSLDGNPFKYYNVTAVKLRMIHEEYGETHSLRFHEFDFGEVPQVVVPTVTTQGVSDIKSTTSTGNGNITATGGENCTKRGVCWNTTGNPTVANSKSEQTGSFGTGPFTRPMTGLIPSTHYYVKAYAYNSAGYGYGGQVEFDTLAPEHYDRSATALLGLKPSGSRTRGYTQSGTALLGLKPSGSRARGYNKSNSALLGLLPTATRTGILTRSNLALLGLLPSGTRVGVVTRSGTGLLGLKGIGSRTVVLTRLGTALLGVLGSGIRTIGAKVGTALLGLKTNGTRVLTLIREALYDD